MSFSGYQIRGDVLSTMKEAAGNYMPDYGNWRYKLAQPPPEEPEKPEKPVIPVVPPENPDNEPGSETRDWGSPATEEVVTAGKTENEFATNCHNADGSRKEGHEYTNSKGKLILCDWDDSGNYEKKNDSVHDVTTPDSVTPATASTEGGYETTWTGTDKDGKRIGEVRRDWGVAEDGSTNKKRGTITPNKKRSPMQSRGDMPPTEQAVPQNPYADIDKFLAKQINLYDINGAVATKDIHDHVKIIMGDVKENVFFKKGKDSKETKNNKHEAATIVDSMHKSFQEDLSEDGTVDTFVQMSKENTISDSITDQEKFVFASMAHLKGVKPAIDENNHMVYPIPMPTGETFPVTNQWMTETIKKRTKPYAFATEFNKNKGAFFDAGRSGHPWDKDTIIMQNKKSIAANPDQLAALYIDKGLLHPDAFVDLTFEKEDQDEASPYTKSMGDNFSNKEFILNAIGDPETRKELEDNLADGMEKIAFATYNRGKAEYDKENKKDKPTAGMSLEEKKKFYQNSTNIA